MVRSVLPVIAALAAQQGGLVSGRQCDTRGLSSDSRSRLVRSGRWTSPTRGVFDVTPGRVVRLDEGRRRAAWLGLLAYGPAAVAVGPSALALLGVVGLPTTIRSEVVVPGTRRRGRDGIRVRHLDPFPTTTFGDCRLATLEAALVQALPDLDREHAVSVLDSVLNSKALDVAGLARVRAAIRGRRGSRRLEGWWGLVDGRAQSPLETRARLVCVDGGVPPDELQVEIRDDDRHLIGLGDLGWRLPGHRWLIAEIDGREIHDTPVAVYSDRRRQNALLATGRVDLVRFTHADILRPAQILTPIRAGLTSRAA